MKYIKKNIKNEPESLRLYRETPGNPSYKGGNFDQAELKSALLKEQGYLCAYCMGRISLDLNKFYKPKIEVEHFLSQAEHEDKALKYQNMLGVCNGLSLYLEDEKIHHCDKTKEGKAKGNVQLLKLDPLSLQCEKLIVYTRFGEILAANQDETVKYDLEKVLNLNNKKLIEARRFVIDRVRKDLENEKPFQQWNKIFIQKHLDKWQSLKNGQYRSYCMIAVWFLQELMKKPQYNR